jgi:hypothetical protein
MRRSILILAFLFTVLFSALPAAAKDFYVAANQATSGTGTGCSTAKPITWLGNPASWGTGSTQIGPGTTVHLCGLITGTPGQQLFVVRSNGTSTSPITIKWEPNAILSAPYWSAMGAIYASGSSYIVFDGGTNGMIRNTANGTNGAYKQSSRALYVSSCNGCVVKNLTIANLYVRTAATDLAPTQTAINCVIFLNANNFTISHLTCHDAGWALAGYGNNLTIEYSNLYNIDHGLAFGAAGRTSGFSIHDNHIHGYVNWDSPTNAYHHDGLHLWGQNGGTVTHGVIYNNVFDGDSGVNITAHIYLQDSIQNVSVYNNVFLVPANRTIVVLWFAARTLTGMPGGNASDNSAYNNFINAGGHAHGSALMIQAQTNFTAHNNIAMGGQSDVSLQGGSTLSSMGVDNNIYLELADYGDRNTFGHNGLVYQTLAQWRSVCHCDANAKLVHLSQINVNSLGQLLSGSVAIGAASNLVNITTGVLAPLSKDKVGAQRPLAGNWDAGAYKFGSVAPPSSPTGLTATIQ